MCGNVNEVKQRRRSMGFVEFDARDITQLLERLVRLPYHVAAVAKSGQNIIKEYDRAPSVKSKSSDNMAEPTMGPESRHLQL